MAEQEDNSETRQRLMPAWQAALFSLIIPGSGQFLLGRRQRGIVFFLSIAVLAPLVVWWGLPILLLPVAGVWAWAPWDAYQIARGRDSSITVPLILGALVIYSLSFDAVEVKPDRLFSNFSGVSPYLRSLAHPELFTRETEDLVGIEPILIPCVSPLPEPAREATAEPDVIVNVACASVGETITVSGEGFFPNEATEFRWINPIGDVQRVLTDGVPLVVTTDDAGTFSVQFEVPQAVPLTQQPAEGETQTQAVRVDQHRPFGPLVMTQTLQLVIEKIGETIALAFMATVLGVLFAVPLSFLAARNLMEGNPITRVIYYVTRTILNVIRSIETLMWAIIFAVWVGLGPFAGTLALWLHTVAALGKLYSEAIESIDPGPIEAIRATGANWPQMVVYAVLPQILPTFTSFTLYRWDINVRLSTVIGLVSDAGLGFLVIQWIRLNRFGAMATAIIAIILVIASLDYFSGWLRQRIIEGAPVEKEVNLVPFLLARGLGLLLLLLVLIWSWRSAETDPVLTAIFGVAFLLVSLSLISGLLRYRADEDRPVADTERPLLRLLSRGLIALGFILLFVWSWRVAEIDLPELVSGAPQGLRIAKAFAVPDLFDRPVEERVVSQTFPVPCGSGEAVAEGSADERIQLSPECGNVGDPLVITGHDLPPNTDVSVRWQFADGGFLRVQRGCCTTDAEGNLRLEAAISPLMQVGGDDGMSAPGGVVITWDEVAGRLQLSDSFRTVVRLSVVTLLMALMATTLGSLMAIPLSFFAARNITGNTPLGRTVYYVFRTTFNITRSVEPLILVLIAAAWVGAGPFAGMLALALNNVPNLGKLFSETIEEIDSGPVDAVKATGANRMQTLVFAIVPQLVPRFLAFILYQWDINIRMSTVIGFVGGGGIGQQFRIWVGLNQYAAAGMATWAIVFMVWTMDYLSARAREEMV